jgi:RNA polymerase sigma factor (sigma-70 family)
MSGAIDNERFRKLLRSYPIGALEFLYDRYYKSLLNIARSLTHDPVASKDIVQETFICIWDNRKKLSKDHSQSIEHYLVRIVRNKSISFYKKTKHLNLDKLLFINDQQSFTANPIETRIIQAEIIQEIRYVISTFPKRGTRVPADENG